MRKSTIMALIAACSISGVLTVPVQAAPAESIQEQLKTKGYSINVRQAGSLDEVKDILKEFCKDSVPIDWKDCPVITPPTENKPGNGTENPGTGNPDNETENPGTGEEALTYAEEVVKLVNEKRAEAGLSPLTLDKNIENAALIRSKETEVSFSHTRPDGRAFSTVLQDNKIPFRGAGENIAWGQKSPQEVMNGWMNSKGHRANILNEKYTKIGVGYYQNASGRDYWTQIFTY